MRKTYEIWESVDKTEKCMFSIDKSEEEYNFLTHDTDGNKMVLIKKLKTKSYKYARSVYNKLFWKEQSCVIR